MTGTPQRRDAKCLVLRPGSTTFAIPSCLEASSRFSDGRMLKATDHIRGLLEGSVHHWTVGIL
jgi:hypothetical protein